MGYLPKNVHTEKKGIPALGDGYPSIYIYLPMVCIYILNLKCSSGRVSYPTKELTTE